MGALKALGHTFGDDVSLVRLFDIRGNSFMLLGGIMHLSWSVAISWMCLRSWRGHGCSIQTGVQSTYWLNVRSRPLRSAWQFGDVSCKSVPYPPCFDI